MLKWKRNEVTGGMETEHSKCRGICIACHRLHSESKSSAKWEAYHADKTFETKHKERKSIYHRNNNRDKRKFIDQKKMEIGKCECGVSSCNKIVAKNNCVTFDFAHKPGDNGKCNKLCDISEFGKNGMVTKTTIPLIIPETK